MAMYLSTSSESLLWKFWVLALSNRSIGIRKRETRCVPSTYIHRNPFRSFSQIVSKFPSSPFLFGYKFLHERNGGRGSFKFLYWQGWMEKPGVYLPHTFIGINIKVSSQIVSNFHLLSSCLDRYSCVKEMEGVASKKVRPGGCWKEKPTNHGAGTCCCCCGGGTFHWLKH